MSSKKQTLNWNLYYFQQYQIESLILPKYMCSGCGVKGQTWIRKHSKQRNVPRWQSGRLFKTSVSFRTHDVIISLWCWILCISGRWSASELCSQSICCQLLKYFISILYVRAFCLNVCIYIMYVPGADREQERALNTLELEFQMVVSHCLGAGNWARPSGEEQVF